MAHAKNQKAMYSCPSKRAIKKSETRECLPRRIKSKTIRLSYVSIEV